MKSTLLLRLLANLLITLSTSIFIPLCVWRRQRTHSLSLAIVVLNQVEVGLKTTFNLKPHSRAVPGISFNSSQHCSLCHFTRQRSNLAWITGLLHVLRFKHWGELFYQRK